MTAHRKLAAALGVLSLAWSLFVALRLLPMVGFLTRGHDDVIRLERAATVAVIALGAALSVACIVAAVRAPSRRALLILSASFVLLLLAPFAAEWVFFTMYWEPIGRGG